MDGPNNPLTVQHRNDLPDGWFGRRDIGHVIPMRGEVVVQGDADQTELWPYAVGSDHRGSTSVVTVDVHDSREFVGVLEMILTRGFRVSRAELHR